MKKEESVKYPVPEEKIIIPNSVEEEYKTGKKPNK